MKILHVIDNLNLNYGGPPKVALEMCQGLAENGQEVTLYTTNHSDETNRDMPIGVPVNLDGVNVFYFPFRFFPKWHISIQLAREIRSNIREFDIVEIHSIYLYHTLVTAYYCRKYNIPYIIMPHGSLESYIRKKGRFKKAVYHFLFENRNLNNAAAIHYTAEEEKLQSHYPLKIKAPAIVIPLGINLSEYRQLPEKGCFRSKYPDLDNKLLILFLGRISIVKGFDLLTKAFAMVVQAHPNARLVIAGPEDPGYGSQVRRWLKDYGVFDKSIFTGMIRGKDKLAVLVDSDLFVLPSYSENFGVALVEAMACGLPVITTDKVNIWRKVDSAKAGEIISCNSEELKNSINNLIDHPELRKKMGKNGKKLVEGKFNWKVISKQLILEYEKLI